MRQFEYSTNLSTTLQDGQAMEKVEVAWNETFDDSMVEICRGTAVVSRDGESYAPVLAASLRAQHEDLFRQPEEDDSMKGGLE